MDKFQRQGDFSDGVGERPPPPPDPIYTFRPHAGEVTAVKYVALRSQGALASGYVVLLQPGCSTAAVHKADRSACVRRL